MLVDYLLILGSFLFSYLVCYRVIPVIVTISRDKKLFDSPNSRSSHKSPTPSLGGLAIFFGFILSVFLFGKGSVSSELKYTMVSVVLMTAIGLKDDIMIISASKKFLIQIFAAIVLIVLADIRITNLNGILGVYEIDYVVSVSLSLLVIVFITNAINLLDGIDGLCSGLISSVLILLAVWFHLQGRYEYVIIATSLVGSLMAFFTHNVFGKKNKIFMGDTGSLILGVVVSSLGITINEMNIVDLNQFGVSAPPIAILALLFVPLTDTFRVFTIRLLGRRSPFSPDKNHLHHMLLSLGMPHIKASLILITINGVVFGLFLLLQGLEINLLLSLLISFGFAMSLTFDFISKRLSIQSMFRGKSVETKNKNAVL